ncbi:MAG: hypothetical protein AAF363_04140 [Bacteroidota bacterium]
MKKIIYLLFLSFLSNEFFAQTVIGYSGSGLAPNRSAMLEIRVDAANGFRGFLMPRLTTDQIGSNLLDTIRNYPEDFEATAGLLVFNSQVRNFRYFDPILDSFIRLNPWQDRINRLNLYTNTNATDSRPFIELFEDVFGADESRDGQLNLGGSTVAVWAGSTNAFVGNQRLTVTDTAVNVETDLNVTGTGGTLNGFGTVPLGGIIMWSGDTINLPNGWALCNGNNGTPNLSGRFIVGVGQSSDGPTNYSVNQTGGEETHTLTKAELPRHHHEARSNGQNDADIHIELSGSHFHNAPLNNNDSGDDFDVVDAASNQTTIGFLETSNASHRHNNSDFDGKVGNGSVDGLDNQAHENRPPFYVLAFIMRVQ